MNPLERYEIDFDEVDFADEMLRAIEQDYGRGVARIAKFHQLIFEDNVFEITVIFTDFRMLEARIVVVNPIYDFPTIHVEGIYY